MYAVAGTWLRTKPSFIISMQEPMEFNKIRIFAIGVSKPRSPRIKGRAAEIIRKGAIVMRIYRIVHA